MIYFDTFPVFVLTMDNPDGDPPKRPKKTLAERREAAKIARRITRQRMEAEELERAKEEERAKEAESKEAQEKHDYEMAMAMQEGMTQKENPLLMPLEEVVPPAENPLLLPDEDNTGQKGIKCPPVSHILACCCGGLFEGTKNLKTHTKENPRCLEFWGGSFECLSQQVRKEFNRRRSLRW